MDNQTDLFGIEDEKTAIQQCIVAVGGPKHAAALLWPAMTLDEATAKLRRCLNPQKRDVLHVPEWMLLAREARRRGCLIGVAYVNDFCECAPPVPVTPEDVEDELRRAYVESVKTQEALVKRLEALDRRQAVRSTAAA